MSFPAYLEYKDSGVQWLGKVPSCWSSVPFGMLFRRIKRTDHGDEELLSVYRDYGVIRKSDRDDNFNNASDDLSSYQLVEPGDLAMNKMKAWQGSLGVSDLRGIVSPAYFVFTPRKQYHPPFMHYLLRSPPYAAGYMTISKGIRINQWDVDPDHLTSLPVLFPSIAEQQAIAAFLDRETTKIDALVAEQERLIALLKEKRQAVISHAVTKGLDTDAAMKDSGIEWLGEIPAHWELLPLKRKWSVTDCKHVTAEFVDDGFPLASIREVQSKDVQLDSAKCTTEEFFHLLRDGERDPRPGDLIFSRNATVGEVAQVTDRHPPFAMGQDVCLLRKLEANLSTSFLQSVLKSPVGTVQMDLLMIGSTFKRINVEEIRTLQVPFPPPTEQIEIAQFAEKAGQEADELIAECVSAKALLQERRAALISAAVTGKIDVRGLASTDNVVSIETAQPAQPSYTVHGVVGAQAIAKFGKLGRMAVMKGGFLAESHAGITEIGGRYERAAAGPYSRAVVQAMEQDASAQFGVNVRESDSRVEYVPPSNPSAVRDALRELVGSERAAKFLDLLDLLKDFGRDPVEAIATLYAAWNDLLAEHGDTTDDAIISEVLMEWDAEKAEKFKRSDLENWLAWMRRHNIVPDGTGPRTDHQVKLF